MTPTRERAVPRSREAEQPRHLRSGPHRERALSAAVELIGEVGVAAVSARVVANRSGVSIGSVTHNFPGRSALLRAAMAQYAETMVCRVDNAFGIGVDGAVGAVFGQRDAAVVLAEMKLLAVRDDGAATSYDRIWNSLAARLRVAGMSVAQARRTITLLEGAALGVARISDHAGFPAAVASEITAILRDPPQ